MTYPITKLAFACSISLFLATIRVDAAGREHLVVQKDAAFNVTTLEVRVGDTVGFRNDDDIRHNVYSISTTKVFDLGSYPTGQSKTVTFDRAGTVDVECALHPRMQMTIKVSP